jgi:hypothetical protein
MCIDFASKAKNLCTGINIYQSSEGVWAFTDARAAIQAHIHNSQVPAALAAYAAIDPKIAARRFSGWAFIDLVDELPCMDATENTALTMVCGAPIPTFPCSVERGEIFGKAVWDIIEAYSLDGCFDRLERPWGSPGLHYYLRPSGFKWTGDQQLNAGSMKAMRKSYRTMSQLQQIMVLTIMHLYCPGKDKTYLTGGCPTKIPAAEAMDILRRNGPALSAWGYMVTHYAGW